MAVITVTDERGPRHYSIPSRVYLETHPKTLTHDASVDWYGKKSGEYGYVFMRDGGNIVIEVSR